MRKFLFLFILLPVSAASYAQYDSGAYRELYESETVASMKEQVGFIASAALEGRAAGSEGEKEAALYISRELESYELELISGKEGELFGIRISDTDTLTSRNVIAVIPGYDKTLRDKYIVIGARMDNLGQTVVNIDGKNVTGTYYGACSNASGLSLLLQLARKLSTNRVLLRRSVIVAAFGASLKQNAGSWYFLNRSFPHTGDIDAMINLDMLGTGSGGFYAYTASNPDMENQIRQMAGTLQPVQPKIVSMEPVQSDHRSFYAKEIPSVFFTTGMYPEYNTVKDTPSIIEYDWMERILEYLYDFSVRLACGPAPDFFESAEKASKNAGNGIRAYYECDVRPSFLGSSDPVVFLKKWVYVYLKYPKEAVDNGVQGRVLLDFVIDEKGKVKDVRVLKGVDPALDAEAVKVVSVSPDWKPARVNGKSVASRMSLYVEFRLKKK